MFEDLKIVQSGWSTERNIFFSEIHRHWSESEVEVTMLRVFT